MHGDARLAVAGAAGTAREDHQRGDCHPGPPAMDPVDKEGVVAERGEPARRHFGEDAAVHQRPVIGGKARIHACDPGAEHDLQREHEQQQRVERGYFKNTFL
ncbi:hypothetical protein VF02_26485, partial [Nostoc linckia z1]